MLLGTKFGPYEILAPLGAGGMGEVYRAKDTRLHREVAFKILSGDSTGDSERHRRFAQEARAASALNHPNILSVYDVGAENGTQYIVSELIEGESLRKLIQKGPVPIKKLLDIAVQIADGLAAAHQAGIVHRDLKPENIMITREGRAKILDFGLAKPLVPTAGTPEDETASVVNTDSGIIVGTVRYMSPEQAGGENIDFRSDQFSLGLILYEMATGKQPFVRNTPVQTLSAIVSEEPTAIATLNPKVPVPVRWLIERCLAKDPAHRYGATVDLYHELRNLRDHLSETTSADVIALAPSRFSMRTLILWMVLFLLVLAVGTLLYFAKASTEIDLSSYRFTPVADDAFNEFSPAWSFDGKSIAYVAETNGILQIFARTLDSPVPIQITKCVTDCMYPFWSPDGSRIFYQSEDALWSVGIGGGKAEQIVKNAGDGTISPDGKTIAFMRRQDDAVSLWFSSSSGIAPKEYSQSPYGAKRFETAVLNFSPDGKKIAIWGVIDKTSRSEFWILPYPSGTPHQVLPNLSKVVTFSSISWMPDSRHIVFSFGGKDFGLQIADTKNDTIRKITSSIVVEEGSAVSPDGMKIAFAVTHGSADLIEIPLDGSPARDLLVTSRIEANPAWSPVRNQYVYTKGDWGVEGVWLKSPGEAWERPVVTAKDFGKENTEVFYGPQFSPDGQRISYMRLGEEKYAIWISSVAGGSPVRLFQGSAHSWSPDGNWIAFLDGNATQLELFKIRVGSMEERTKLISGKGHYQNPLWSPKGDWITYVTNEGLLLVRPDGQQKITLTTEIPISHGWSKDGSNIFVIKSTENKRLILASIQVQDGKEKVIADLGNATLSSEMAGFSLAPDGKSFAATRYNMKADIWMLEGFNKQVGFFDRLWNRWKD